MDATLVLNNEGVKLLNRGDYRSAARLFRRAFQDLKSAVAKRRQQSRRSKIEGSRRSDGSAAVDERGDDEEDALVSNDAGSAESKANKNQNEKRKRARDMETLASADGTDGNVTKRQKMSSAVRSAEATFESTETGVLGRPLWLASLGQVSTPKAFNACGSSILYNYAYSLQRLQSGLLQKQMSETRKEQKRVLWRESMRVYDEAILLAAQGNNPVVQWVACHNKQYLLTEQDTFAGLLPEELGSMYQALESRKIEVLRSTAKGSSSDRYPLVVLSMLGIEGNNRQNRPAAAA